MINLVVDDHDEALKQVAEGGAPVIPDIQQEDYGRFGWLVDPEGTKIELWGSTFVKGKSQSAAPGGTAL